MSFETSFDSKQPKLEPKLVSALSETKLLFRLFRFYTKTEILDVSIDRNKQKTNRNSLTGSIFGIFSENLGFSGLFLFVLVCFEIVCFCCFASIPKQRVSMFRPTATKTVWYRAYFGIFYENLVLFRFVSKQFCFVCFDIGSKHGNKPKQTEIFCFCFQETNRTHNPNRSCFGLFRFEPKLFFCLFRGHPNWGGCTIPLFQLSVWCEKVCRSPTMMPCLEILSISNNRNTLRWVLFGISQDGAFAQILLKISAWTLTA